MNQTGGLADVFVGLGANLPAADGAPPVETCRRALAALEEVLGGCVKVSPWYSSAPVPESDQPWFVNGVALFRSSRPARDVLALLLAIERRFGRERAERWAARRLDLDLLARGAAVIDEPGLTVPHPRLAERGFVLRPLADIAPGWRHPRDRRGVAEMLAVLPSNQRLHRITD